MRSIERIKTDVLLHLDEKPELPHWFNIGFILAQHCMTLKMQSRWSLVDWINATAEEDLVLVHKHKGYHFTVNTEYDLTLVNERFTKLFGRRP